MYYWCLILLFLISFLYLPYDVAVTVTPLSLHVAEGFFIQNVCILKQLFDLMITMN